MFFYYNTKSQTVNPYSRFAPDFYLRQLSHFNWFICMISSMKPYSSVSWYSSIITFSIGMNFQIGWPGYQPRFCSKLLRVLSMKCSAADSHICICWVPPPMLPPLVGESYSAFGNMKRLPLNRLKRWCSHRYCHPHNDGLNIQTWWSSLYQQWQDQLKLIHLVSLT